MSAMSPVAVARGRDRMVGMATFASERPDMLAPRFADLRGIYTTTVVEIGGRRALHVEFDPEAVSYEQLLERFWQLAERAAESGTDGGSAVLVHSFEQERLANAARERRSLVLGRPDAVAVVRARRGRPAGLGAIR